MRAAAAPLVAWGWVRVVMGAVLASSCPPLAWPPLWVVGGWMQEGQTKACDACIMGDSGHGCGALCSVECHQQQGSPPTIFRACVHTGHPLFPQRPQAWVSKPAASALAPHEVSSFLPLPPRTSQQSEPWPCPGAAQ